MKPVINLNGWETIKSFADRKGFSTQFVYKLIKQGKVKSLVIPELNDMKLVKESGSE